MNGSPESVSDSDPIWKWLGGKWAFAALCVVLLVVALYIEEDWRGAAEWNDVQSQIAKAGESVDPRKFIPPPVPDDQNFAALPVFDVDTSTGWSADPVGVHRTFAKINPEVFPSYPEKKPEPDRLPYTGNWLKAEPPDAAIQSEMAVYCDTRGIKAPSGATPLQMFQLLCPALATLRAEEKARPLCRFNLNYRVYPVMPWAGAVSSRLLNNVLTYEERLALLEHRTDTALADLEMDLKINAGLRNEALLVPGLFAVSGQASQLDVIAQGISEHLWSREQLAKIDTALGAIDNLATARLGVRGNIAIVTVPSTDYLETHRSAFPEAMFGPRRIGAPGPSPVGLFIVTTIGMALPGGWMDEWKAQAVKLNLLGAIKMVDPAKHRAYPEQQAKAMSLVTTPRTGGFWNDILLRNMEFGVDAMPRFAYGEVQIDEGRIACRLEHYWLDHGHYPASLAELSPAYGTDLPHDVMNGEPYHYQLLPDGTYLLYSVAWDQKDDGGKEGTGVYHYYLEDPDWPWHNHPHAAKPK